MSLGEPGGVEEERRLLYVAMTRAKDHLDVTFPQRFYHRRFSGDDRHSYAPLSRFLQPVTDQFDLRVAAPPESTDAVGPTTPGVDPVDGLLDDLFG
jgi:DNA helicase-2/ATP-dependent DNA helicase PcrA